MRGMIFAAGLGTRLKPFTDSAPKALFPLCGHPLLYWAARRLCEGTGVDTVVVNVHHFAGQVVGYIESEEFRAAFPGVDFAVSDESGSLLETGGGLLKAERFLEGGDFLMHNADIVSDADIPGLAETHRSCGALATLLVSGRQTSRYLLADDEDRLVGWQNVSTGQVRSPWPDLDAASCRKYAFSGIHAASPGIFKAMRDLGFADRFSITDFYIAACRDYDIRCSFNAGLHLADAGRPENIPAAQAIVEESEVRNGFPSLL